MTRFSEKIIVKVACFIVSDRRTGVAVIYTFSQLTSAILHIHRLFKLDHMIQYYTYVINLQLLKRLTTIISSSMFDRV